MNRLPSFFVLAATLLVAVGCASYDDTSERAEFEKLRNHPVTPRGDSILPSFESTPSSEDSQSFAILLRTRPPEATARNTRN